MAVRRTATTLDGASNVDHGSVGTQVNNISVDAIQEFKLVSSPYSAEYGAQAGPAVNVVTKRGTTEFHGSVFEFFRHDALNAYSWESKQRTVPEKPQLRFNNFGGFVVGPAYKQKLFFFGGLEFKRPRTGRSLSEIVPTEAMRRGDFSAFLPAGVAANKIPQVAIQGYSQISGNGLPYTIDARNWELRDNLTEVWGAHTWKFGMQYVNAFKSENTRVRDGGDITFSTGSTAGTSFRPQDAGHAVANLLLGAFTRYTETSNTTNAPTHYNQFEVYANDQWRAQTPDAHARPARAVHPLGRGRRRQHRRLRPDALRPFEGSARGQHLRRRHQPDGRSDGDKDARKASSTLITGSCSRATRRSATRAFNVSSPTGPRDSPRAAGRSSPRVSASLGILGATARLRGAGIYYDRTLLNPLRDSGANAPFASVATLTNGRQFTTPANLAGLSGFVNPLDTVGAGGTGRPLV